MPGVCVTILNLLIGVLCELLLYRYSRIESIVYSDESRFLLICIMWLTLQKTVWSINTGDYLGTPGIDGFVINNRLFIPPLLKEDTLFVAM
jgi:hypothetical protein